MEKRTVKLKTSVKLSDKQKAGKTNKELVHINFTSMGDDRPTADDYGVKNKDNKAKLNNALQYMSEIDEQFFQWLENDARNAILFVNDPMKALRTAIPDLDESVFKNLHSKIFS